MNIRRKIRSLLPDSRGTALIEFAILAPVIFGMMLGVMYIGLQMMSYNAIRAITSDVARYTVVEYQKSDELNIEQIESKAIALAVNPPYQLTADSLDVLVTNPVSDIATTNMFTVQIRYTPYNPVEFLGIGNPTLTETRSFYVAE